MLFYANVLKTNIGTLVYANEPTQYTHIHADAHKMYLQITLDDSPLSRIIYQRIVSRLLQCLSLE